MSEGVYGHDMGRDQWDVLWGLPYNTQKIVIHASIYTHNIHAVAYLGGVFGCSNTPLRGPGH